jgi:hypothetical protein
MTKRLLFLVLTCFLVSISTQAQPVAPLAGTYYIVGDSTGTSPDPSREFSTLQAAIVQLNSLTSPPTDTVRLLIWQSYSTSQSSTTMQHVSNFPVIIKPAPGRTGLVVEYTSTTNGIFRIGADNNDPNTQPDLVTIDGSNLPNGTTRDLTFRFSNTNMRNGLTVIGSSNRVTIKNLNIVNLGTSTQSSHGILIRPRYTTSTLLVPDSLTIENCVISHTGSVNSRGIGVNTSGTAIPVPGIASTHTVIRNNIINAGGEGIRMEFSKNFEISGNQITVSQSGTNTARGIYLADDNGASGNVSNIFANQITSVAYTNSANTNGAIGIDLTALGTYNIYNNFVAGLSGEAGGTGVLFGLNVEGNGQAATLRFQHNSILIGDSPLNTSDVIAGANFEGNLTSTRFENNIVSVRENDAPNAYCIKLPSSQPLSTFVSNFNNFHVGGTSSKVGFYDNTDAPTLALWQTASSRDANSVSKSVTFVSASDLHLTGSSNGDIDLIGTPIAAITTDIDGNPRSTLFPYMGADEASIPLPVELISFSARTTDGGVLLSWRTASELNNAGFEVERQSNAGAWNTLGFVEGRGTTTQTQSYFFLDKSASGKVFYRLKQLDFDGRFEYSNIIEVDAGLPTHFALEQNYPNPFNPSTIITYQLPVASDVKLEVFDMLGKKVATLVSGRQDAGLYNYTLNATNLSSGVYFYRLQAGSFTQTKKMMFVK